MFGASPMTYLRRNQRVNNDSLDNNASNNNNTNPLPITATTTNNVVPMMFAPQPQPHLDLNVFVVTFNGLKIVNPNQIVLNNGVDETNSLLVACEKCHCFVSRYSSVEIISGTDSEIQMKRDLIRKGVKVEPGQVLGDLGDSAINVNAPNNSIEAPPPMPVQQVIINNPDHIYEGVWRCEFCHYPNFLPHQVASKAKEVISGRSDVIYQVGKAQNLNNQTNFATTETNGTRLLELVKSEPALIFCIDLSGSMNTTTEINTQNNQQTNLKFGGISPQELEMLRQFMEPGDQAQLTLHVQQKKSYISRKQCILSAIESQLLQLKKASPNKKIAFVLFNTEVTLILADSTQQPIRLKAAQLENKEKLLHSLTNVSVTSTVRQSCDALIEKLLKLQAQGQTALGPALLASIDLAGKSGPGSSVILCTDGLANIGMGALEPIPELAKAFYDELAVEARAKNVTVSVVTIKGQAAKISIIGKLAQATNGSIKIVNPEKLSEDFANVLKDQVVGFNMSVSVMLHRALVFRNQLAEYLHSNQSVLKRDYPNATINTKLSFEYELRPDEDLNFMEIDIASLKSVPFQVQFRYTSPLGGQYVRVLSTKTQTTDAPQSATTANLNVLDQRINSNTAQLHTKGQSMQSVAYNAQWRNYVNTNFAGEQHRSKREQIVSRGQRLEVAITNKMKKQRVVSDDSEGSEEEENQRAREAPLNRRNVEQLERCNLQQAMDISQPQKQQKGLSNLFGLLGSSSSSKAKQSAMRPPVLSSAQNYSCQSMAFAESASVPQNRRRGQKKEARKIQRKASMCESDSDEMEIVNNAMEKQGIDLE